MAANKKTYEIVVETEVDKATGEMKELGSVVRTTAGDFDNINSAIAGTEDALGKLDPVKDAKEFKTLSKELQDLRDRQQDVQIQSLRFTEALAEQPGIVGAVGGSIEGLRGAFKALAANPIIAVLALITGAFFALRESLQRSEEGTEALNRISASLSGIMDGLFKIIEPIALAFAQLAEQLLTNEKVLNGLATAFAAVQAVITPLANFIKNTLINNFQTLIGVAGGLGKVLKGVFTFDLDTIKSGVDDATTAFTDGVKGAVDNAKGLGQDISDEFSSGISDRADKIKNSITKPYKEASKEISEEEQKRLDEQQAKAEERAAKLKEAEQIVAQAELALKDERQQELLTREKEYQENLKKLREAGIEDTTALEERYRQDIQAINDKFDTEEEKKRQEQKEKEEAEKQARKEKELAEKQAEREERLLEIENEREFEDITFQEELELLNEKEQILLDNQELNEAERTRIVKQFEQQRTDIKDQQADQQNQIKQTQVDLEEELQDRQLGLAVQFGQLLQQLGEENKGVAIAGLVVEQAAAVAQIIVDTKRANAKLTAQLGIAAPPFIAANSIAAGISIASAIAATAKGIRDIRSADSSSSSTSSTGAAGSSTPRTANLPAAPSLPDINPPQIAGGGEGVDTGRQVAETIGETSRRPVRAFVVSEDVSTQQQLDRRVKGSASF